MTHDGGQELSRSGVGEAMMLLLLLLLLKGEGSLDRWQFDRGVHAPPHVGLRCVVLITTLSVTSSLPLDLLQHQNPNQDLGDGCEAAPKLQLP